MNYLTPVSRRRNTRAFLAAFITYVMLAGQVAPLALAARAAAARPAPKSESAESAPATQAAPALAAPVPQPLVAENGGTNAVVGPVITASKVDTVIAANGVDADPDGIAAPGQLIEYQITITNTGTEATNVTLNDTVDTNTTLQPGTVRATPLARNDAYNVIGNVQINVPDGASDLLANDQDPDAGDNTGMTATAESKKSANCGSCATNNVTINADGSFSYNPPPGFTGTDTFTYTASSAGDTNTATVTLTVGNGTASPGTNVIWFVKAGAASGGDGRLTSPFNCLVGTGCFDPVAADEAGDIIFLFSGTYTDTGALTLLNTQKLIGEGATDPLAGLAGVTVPPHSDALPTTGGTNPTIATTGVVTSILTLGQNNTLRGFTTGDTTGADIVGNTFGTLNIGKSASPDVTIGGTGQALNLSGGTLAVTGGLSSVTSTSSTLRGIFISGVADSDGAGGSAFSFGSTTVSGATQESITVTASTADINFGNTTVGTASPSTGGTDGIALSNNSAGTRTFGTLTIQNNSGIAFRHFDPDAGGANTGGGATTVTGAATITNPGGAGVSVDGSTTTVTFAGANITQSGGAGLSYASSSGNLSFTDLDIAPDSAVQAISTNGNTGTLTATSGTISTTGAAALNILSTPLALLFDSVSASNNGSAATGINLTSSSGSFSAAAGTITGGTNAAFNVNSGSVQSTYGGSISQSNNAALVSVSGGHTGAVNFNGTVSATNGTGLQFDNADGTYNFNSTTTMNGGDAGVDITNGSGGTFLFGTGAAITNPTGTAFRVDTSAPGVTYSGSITKNGTSAGLLVDITGQTGGTITFQTGTLSSTSSAGTGIQLSNADGTVNFNGTTTLNGGDSAIDIISGSSGTFAFPSGTSINNPSGIAYREDTSSANVTYAGTIVKNNNANSAVDINAKSGGTTAFSGAITASTTTANAIDLTNTGGTMNFTGGLNITTTSGVGFNATGGGTVSATQNNSSILNLITTTTGTALNVANTNIGASGLTFRSITSNGGTNGIVLNTTGSSGGLTITGNGGTCTTAVSCTGGSIQNKTGDAISLNSTSSVSLTRMFIFTTGQSHIDATTVNGLSLTNMYFDLSTDHGILGDGVTTLTADDCMFDRGGFNQSGKHGIFITNLKGTSSVTDSTFKRSGTIQFFVTNTTATAAQPATPQDILTLSHNTWNEHTGSFGGDHFSVLAGGNGTASQSSNMRLNVDGTGGENKTGGLLAAGSNEGGNAYNVQATNAGKVDARITAVDAMNVTAGVNVATTSNGTVLFDVFSNKSANGTGFTSTGTPALNLACINGTCTGKFRDNSIVHTAPANVNAINITQEGSGTNTVEVSTNVVNGGFQRGIQVQSRLGTGTTNATLTNNTLTATDGAGLQVINVETGASGSGHNNTICLNMANNSATPAGAMAAYRLVNRGGANCPSCTFLLQNFVGNGASATDVENWIKTTKSNLPFTGPFTVSITNSFGTSSGCPTPTLPSSPETFDGNSLAGSGTVPVSASGKTGDPVAQPVVGINAPTAATGAGASSGMLPSLDNRLREVVPTTRNVPAASMQMELRKTGRGSSLRHTAKDSSGPLAAAEPLSAQRKTAPRTPVSTGGPSSGDVPTTNPPVINGNNISWNLGTLQPNQSVTVTFRVQVNNPYTGGQNVSNQGTVTCTECGSSIQTDDPAVGGAADPTLTPIDVTNIFARDAKQPEPATGTSQMLFTIALSSPATGAVSVSASTADGTATGGATCTTGVDYESISNVTVNFSAGQQIKTVPVNICSDSESDDGETLLLNISNASGGTILDAQATGTITANTPGTFVISEIRTFGPGAGNDPNDEFVELYNNTDSPITVAASDASAGWGVYTMTSGCDSAPLFLGTIPNGTVIPARGHYLLTGSAYSLANYGGTGAAAGNLTMAADIPSNASVAIFTTSETTNISTATRLDAVGFGANTGGAICDLMREGTPATPPTTNLTLLGQYTILRDMCGKGGSIATFGPCPAQGNPQDSNDNASDFFMVDPNGTDAGAGQRIGTAGPENLASPIRRDTSGISLPLLDASVSASAPPNRLRNFTSDPGNNSSQGTLTIRRKVTNNTGAPITRLRFRIIDLTAFNAPAGVADLRARTSTTVVVSGVGDASTCSPNPAPCSVTVQGTTLEEPPTQPEGGGINSTLSAGTITTGSPLANGASINVQFLLGIEQTGNFRFVIIIEALP